MGQDVAANSVGALVEFDPNMGYEALAELVGQQVGSDLTIFPRLRINFDHEDETGEFKLPAGAFVIHTDKGNVYAKKVLFRPFLNRFQYVHFDADTEQFVNKSIIFNDFREEAIDERGGLRCGKPNKKMREAGLTAEQAKLNKAVQVFRNVYGAVTFVDGKTMRGEPVAVENMSCVIKLRGANFMPIGDVFKGLTKARKLMFNYNLELTTKREKKGTITYYVIQFDVDRTKDLPFTPEDMDLMKEFGQVISKENGEIGKKHDKAARAKVSPTDAIDADVVAEVSGGEALDADFEEVKVDLNDEIPF